MRGCSREWTELEIETAQSLFVNLMELMRLIRLRVKMVEETIARQRLGRLITFCIIIHYLHLYTRAREISSRGVKQNENTIFS